LCIEAIVLGSGASEHPYRGQASVLVATPDVVVLVDYGCGVHSMLARLGYEVRDVSLVVFTHGHYDHVCGLPLTVFNESHKGGGILELIADDVTYSVLEMLLEAVYKTGTPRRFKLKRVGRPPVELHGVGSVNVDVFPVRHSIEAYGVEVSYDGLRVVISGDTAPHSEVARRASGASIVIHEATLPARMGLEEQYRIGHTSVDEAVRIASKAERGILYHISPESELDAFKYAREAGVVVAWDGYGVKVC